MKDMDLVKTTENLRCQMSNIELKSILNKENSEADRWLKEATEQRARAELAEMQRDELAQALDAAKRMMIYAGKEK